MTAGRRKPYTDHGIRRVPCARCGAPSHHQWNCCALDGRWLGVCGKCDVDLNRLALEFFQVPDRDQVIIDYVVRKYRAGLSGGAERATTPGPLNERLTQEASPTNTETEAA